jgi:hypothetical protein
MRNFWNNHTSARGLTLVEAIIYVAITALLLVAIVDMSLVFGGSQSRLATARIMNRSAHTALERMTYEIARASSVDIGASALAVDPGVLALNTTNDADDPIVDTFYLSDGALVIEEDGTVTGSLTESGVRVVSLIFERITTSGSEAVRVTMTLEAGTGSLTRTNTFYTTVILRNSY